MRALPAAAIEWREAKAPASRTYGDVYYDAGDGRAESEHCFLQGNELPERWATHKARRFCIAETGFGTGLNFLLTWHAWRRQTKTPHCLHFISTERHPLSQDDLNASLGQWPMLATLANALCAQYPPPLPGCHRLSFDGGAVLLDLYLGDAQSILCELARSQPRCVDAWYFDGFAPAKNPDMWQQELFLAAAALSNPGATAATFTAAGDVRRALLNAGFEVKKVPGFGRKRESLRAKSGCDDRENSANTALTQSSSKATHAAQPLDTPWEMPDSSEPIPHKALVIGGGLAGCWAAYALADRGIAVTLLESAEIATAASGNDQGILYTRLSHKHSALTDFALHSFLYASRQYASMFARAQLVKHLDGELCGQLQLQNEGENLQRLATTLKGLEGLAYVASREEAQTLLGIRPASGGIWYPGSGWLRPASVCAALLSHELIEYRQHTAQVTLQRKADQWLALDSLGETLASAPCAVLATGSSSTQQAQLQWLPLRSIRGQTSHLTTSVESAKLRAAVCSEGYMAPARKGKHCVGASFNLDDTREEENLADHADNIAKVADALPTLREELEQMDSTTLQGRVGFRCATPDYLPVVGQVPDYNAFIERFGALRDNAKKMIARRGFYQPGLYVSAGHGSRGLTSTPLAAQVIAAAICNEPAPLEHSLRKATAPGRFIIRDLARGRV